MTNRPPIKTPFEIAEFNAQLHPKRMALCEKINELTETLIEIQRMNDMISLNEGSDMFDEEVAAIAREEESRIMTSLAIIAETWERLEGVSA